MNRQESLSELFRSIAFLSLQVVVEMLEYLYTASCPRLNELGAELLIAADKYSLAGLKLQCERALAAGVTTENAAEFLILADLHHASQLRRRALEYITQHSLPVSFVWTSNCC